MPSGPCVDGAHARNRHVFEAVIHTSPMEQLTEREMLLQIIAWRLFKKLQMSYIK